VSLIINWQQQHPEVPFKVYKELACWSLEKAVKDSLDAFYSSPEHKAEMEEFQKAVINDLELRALKRDDSKSK